MTTKTTNKIKKILAMVLAFAMVFGMTPMQTVANAMEVTFASFDSADGGGMPLGGYLVSFAEGNFPFAYEAYEGQENLVFSQSVTITSGGGLFSDGVFAPPVNLPVYPPVVLPPASTPTDLLPEGEDEPEDGEYGSGEIGGGDYPNGDNGYANGENGGNGNNGYENGYSHGYTNGDNGYQNGGYQNGNGYENGGNDLDSGADYTEETADPAADDELPNSIALVWYLNGERRTDKGTFSTSADLNWLPGDIIPMELRFDEVTAADMGVWTLRAYSYGEWVESPYALFLQVGEGPPLAGIMPMADDANELIAAIAAAPTSAPGNLSPTIINITGNIPLSAPLVIPPGANITLSGAGTLTATGNFEAVFVDGGAILTIAGITITRTPGTVGRGVRSWGHLIMNSGTISGHNHPGGGAGVLTWGNTATEPTSVGLFDMHGGTISGNTVTEWNGGGVQVGGTTSVFNMHSGTISTNTSPANSGGGVVSFTTFNMYGGTISNNTAGFDGGGVMIWDGNATLAGGTISGNTANFGGGVMNWGSNLTMNNANALITANTARFGGGGVSNHGGTFNMSAGTISQNIAQSSESHGGGVRNFSDVNQLSSTFNMTGGTITANTAGAGAGVSNEATHHTATSTFTMSGAATISNNTAIRSGGGVRSSIWAVFNLQGGTISNNNAPPYSGDGVMIAMNGTLNHTGGTLIGNSIVGAPAVTVNLVSVTQIGGVDGVSSTTALRIVFSQAVHGLHPYGIALFDGITLLERGGLSTPDGGITWDLAITAVLVPNGTEIMVGVSPWAGFIVASPTALPVTVYRAPTPHTVTWHTNGGSPAPTQTSVTAGGSITAPIAMTRAGYTFGGWYMDAGFTTAATFPITNVVADVTLWARWTSSSDNQAPPTGITSTNETATGANDGAIIGVTALMEWRAAGAATWTLGTGATITGLAPGVYHVRFAERPNFNASPYTVVEIQMFVAVAPTITGGQTTMQLTEGYSATHTTAFTISGNPAPTVTIAISGSNHGNRITWNTAQNRIDIAAGLPVGVYTVTLTANNGITPNANRTFTLTVVAQQGGDNNGGNNGNDTSNGGDDSGDGAWAPTTPTVTSRTITVNDVSVNVSISQGTATLNLPTNTVNQIVSATQNNTALNDTVIFNLSNISGVTITSAVIPTTALRQLATAGEDGLSVEIRLPQGTVNLDSAAGVSAANQSGANLQISLNRVNHNQVPAGQRGEIRSGDVVFRIAVSSGTNTINEFDGIITITLPFTGTFPASVWYLDASGNLHRMESTYNRTARTVTFTTNHLSLFVVGHDDGTRPEVTAGDTDEGITDIPPGGYPNVNYNPPTGQGWENPFTDVVYTDWFFDSVRFAHQNNLFAGTSADTFSPGSPMTRAMMVTVLYRMAGEPSVEGLTNTFTDVENGRWHSDAIMWAAANGIVSGIGNGQFAPSNNVTREQMAAILNRYAEHMGLTLPTIRTGTFADEAEISAWARESVNAMFEAGVLNGVGDNHFNPRGQGTRAEVATMLRNFMEATGHGTTDPVMLNDDELYFDRREEEEAEQSNNEENDTGNDNDNSN